MSRLWPHTTYAEEQPYYHSILTTHVLTRAIQSGSLVGAGISSTVFALRNFKILKPRIPSSTLTTTLLRSSGIGAIAGFGLLCVGLPMQMRGKEEIEWRDRSWRLLENQGQLECDDWTYPAMVAGGLAAATQRSVLGWKGVIGGIGAGSVLGMAGYMGWRYGVKGGKREETTV
ncbi:hypothetical protein DL98DRAFT_517496 [Cadophora sp. DSE1049]|nr:hypothetical protein DL98DRAFT_517496 [Cadophora sp. DSE1049]